MLKKISIVLASASLVFTGNSFANTCCNTGIYVQALGGIAMGSASSLHSNDIADEADGLSISSGVGTTDNTALWGAAVGYELPTLPLRFELQGMHINEQSYKASTLYPVPQYHEFDNMDVRSNILLANAYYTVSLCGFKPFVGGGIGGARNTVSGSYYSDSVIDNIPGVPPTRVQGGWRDQNQTNFAYDLTAGVGYQFTPHLSASLAYQYLCLGKVSTVTGTYSNQPQIQPASLTQTLSTDKLSFNNVMLGVAYTF